MRGKKNQLHLDEKLLGSATFSGELFTRVLDGLDSPAYLVDLGTKRIIYANRPFLKGFNFDPTGSTTDELQKNFSFGGAKGQASVKSAVGADGAGDEQREVQVREYLYPLTKKWYLEKSQDLEWQAGRWLSLVLFTDITAQKQLASFLDEAQRQADRTIAANSKYVALVAHDLKSPFHSIISMLERILKKETFDHEIHEKFLRNIITNGERMLRMIDSLLDIHRLDKGQIRLEQSYFKLHQLVAEALTCYSHDSLQKKLVMENRVPEELEIFADKNLYSVVLNNLISNAVKFSFKGGRVEIYVKRNKDREILVVRDEGKGIAEKLLNDIFKPEVNTTQCGTSGESGSGLGLIFCQQIMRAHGGSISIKSVEGAGASFYVELSPSCRLPAGETSR